MKFSEINDQWVHKIEKKNKLCGTFFRFLLLNISSVKGLLNKPSEIQRNISGALPGKLKRKFFFLGGALSYKIIPPEIRRMPCCFGSNNQGRIYMS